VDTFKITFSVPVSCKRLIFNKTLIAVEHKKVRIRHKLLYVKYISPVSLMITLLSFDRPEKL